MCYGKMWEISRIIMGKAHEWEKRVGKVGIFPITKNDEGNRNVV